MLRFVVVGSLVQPLHSTRYMEGLIVRLGERPIRWDQPGSGDRDQNQRQDGIYEIRSGLARESRYGHAESTISALDGFRFQPRRLCVGLFHPLGSAPSNVPHK